MAGFPTGRWLALSASAADVVVVDGLVDQVPAGRHADLALVQERAPGAGRDRAVQVHVVQDDEGGVAAEFEVHALEVAPGQLADPAARGGGPGEGDQPHEGLGDQRLTGRRPARQHVQQAVRQPGLGEDPGQRDATAHRGARIGLEHHGVAQGQRGRDRADGQDLGEVERRDHADHADGNALGEAQPGLLAGQQLAVGAGGQRGGLVDLGGRDVGLESHGRRDLAALPDPPPLDLGRVGQPQIGRTAQHR